MKGRKTAVYLMTVLLVFVIAIVELYMMWEEGFSLSVNVTTADHSETIESWSHDGCYYVFLPSYADPQQTHLVVNPFIQVRIQDKKVGTQTVCADFPFNEALPIVYHAFGKTREKTIYFCQSGNVPTLYIDTASGTMDYIHEEKGNAESGNLRLYTSEGTLDCSAQIESINGRGNATWNEPKRPYSLELAQRKDLLGMGEARKWILLANYFDDTNLRNKMCYDFAAAAGCAYTPECQWVDLYLNGSYAGLYVISERNEVDPQRVAIPKDNGFLVSKEGDSRWDGQNYSAFFSQNGTFLRIHHNGIQGDRAQEIWQSVEDAIFAPDGIDPTTEKHWQDMIDLDSWAQQYLLWEVFAEFDAGTLSKFFYYDGRSDKVFAGPLWDMDMILNNWNWYPPTVLSSGRKYISDRNQVSLFHALYQKEAFSQRVKELYWQIYHPLLKELIENGMDDYLNQSLAAGKMNGIRWKNQDPQEAIHIMKQYLKEHIAFLDDYWISEDDYCIIELVDYTMDYAWRNIAVRRGEPADFLPTYSYPWVDCETGELFDATAPVTRDHIIQLDFS